MREILIKHLIFCPAGKHLNLLWLGSVLQVLYKWMYDGWAPLRLQRTMTVSQ